MDHCGVLMKADFDENSSMRLSTATASHCGLYLPNSRRPPTRSCCENWSVLAAEFRELADLDRSLPAREKQSVTAVLAARSSVFSMFGKDDAFSD
jgi:hypothetical protein